MNIQYFIKNTSDYTVFYPTHYFFHYIRKRFCYNPQKPYLMEKINHFLSVIDSYIGGSSWFIYLLLGTGLFFTIYLRFPQIRFFRRAIRILSGKYDHPDHEGDTSHFQALATALSGTIGTGNIAGVALAIHLGGAGALFWMLISAFLGMTTKMVEVTLSHKYREKDSKGNIAGGPMYYMKNRLKMRWLAAIFAFATVLSSFGTGSLPQINSISNAMYSSFNINHILTGGILTVLLGFIIIGGLKRIVKVSEKIVPAMAIVYFIGAISVIVYNYENIIPSIAQIFTTAFTGSAATGGFLGAGFAWAFNRGVNRGLFSNEAGQGSAPIAHAAARTNEPISEGLVATLEPFIDTIIVCFITGLVLLTSGVWEEKVHNDFQNTDIFVLAQEYDESSPADKQAVADFIQGKNTIGLYNGNLNVKNGKIIDAPTIIHAHSFAEEITITANGIPYNGFLSIKEGQIENKSIMDNQIKISGKSLIHSAPLSSEAFKRGFLGDMGQYIIPICLLLFAFSTAVAWSYYGDRAVTYLWGSKYVWIYHIIYVIGFFIASFVDTTIIWTLSGITVALMTIPNLLGILMLHKEMKSTLKKYEEKIITKDS